MSRHYYGHQQGQDVVRHYTVTWGNKHQNVADYSLWSDVLKSVKLLSSQAVQCTVFGSDAFYETDDLTDEQRVQLDMARTPRAGQKEHGLPFKEALEYDEQMKKALVSALQRGSAQEIRQVLDCWLHGRPEETTDVPEEKQTGPKTITRGFEPEKLLLLDLSLGFTVVPASANNKSCWGMCGRTTECRVKDSDGATYYYCRTCMLDHVRDKFGSTELDPASKEDQVSPQDPQG